MSSESEWTKQFSKKHNREYWFNSVRNISVWEEPPELSCKKRKIVDAEPNNTPTTVEVASKKPAVIAVEVAIIIPFRDPHNQERSEQLRRFIPHMNSFLSKSNKKFRIYIIEQSDDNRKFNRGKLLNIGFDLAARDGSATFVLHDVDLLPSPELLPYYTETPRDNPVHIARVWEGRYSTNPKYFGGVVAFSRAQFERINGFPNNFWGWGGEDDEMYRRTVENDFKPTSPTEGSITDLENLTLGAKLGFLRANPLLKCMNKSELLDEHAATWATNGLRVNAAGDTLHYTVLSRDDTTNANCSRVLVDVGLNDHWTDKCCGLTDTQFDALPGHASK